MARLMKRKSLAKTRKYKKPRGPKARFAGKAGIARVINKIMAKSIETKESTQTRTDGGEMQHNSLVMVEPTSTFLRTNQGTADAMGVQGDRIGDEIKLKGISIKIMFELNERFSDVTHRLMLVRSAKGDTPTAATMFKGQTGNKLMDDFNTERYSIVFSKFFKLTAPNLGSWGGTIVSVAVDSGTRSANEGQMAISRATKLVRLYIPGAKFGRNGVLKYENASVSQLKFYDYNLVCFAYSNYSTNELMNVSRINDYVKTMYYTDA